ncbi:2,4-dihydroxyhept-2-ene-1,7-dioic acid aldolase [Mesorhizobium sp. BR1-1-16]|uniref:HpcH/HpaI aldolase family protein n=1 Tax=Mesorhizobium sp. BR1-1-16 TaxID=2876653 RepID=UPI001CCC58E5|nr:aldolase/citrate lyase family protein [Mesorhizobium sp. BR1-1-16]MBZ9937566.1 2,4-dihydroxyhept-2-ene-1,7-dioic acid aldolase [Mesorhizobium sp. BR1-1-16]
MTFVSLAARLAKGSPALSAWIAMPDPLVAESAARAGFDCVTLDMQHGLHDAISVMRGIGAVTLAGRSTIVRVPVGDFAMASRALDMGASAVIAPMINSADDATALVAATKYPPVGQRSWGPTRTIQLQGVEAADYLATANMTTLVFAMIETVEAMTALDAILAVPGLDAVFIGPSDLSIALSAGANVDPMRTDNQEAASLIRTRAHAAGKKVGIFALNGAQARLYRMLGYDFIAVGVDAAYFALGAATMLSEARRD